MVDYCITLIKSNGDGFYPLMETRVNNIYRSD